MKKILTVTTITFFAVAATLLASPESEKIVAAEKNIWQLLKDKNIDAFQKLLSPDFRGVYGSGINKAAEEVAEVRKMEFQSFTLGEMDVVFIDKDVALVTYPATVDATMDGKDMSGKTKAASIWKKEGNDWHIAFHTDMKAD